MCVQESDRAPPWSCAKQLSAQLEPPTPHAFPAGIVPTPRGTPQKHAAAYHQGHQLHSVSGNQISASHKRNVTAALPSTQTAELVVKPFASSSSQHQPHQSAVVSSQAAAQEHLQGDDELSLACQQLAQAARRAASSSEQQLTWQEASDAPHYLKNGTEELLQANTDLPSACQQLAETVGAHAEQRASLQQAFEALSADQPLFLTQAAVVAANTEPRTSQNEQGSSAELCAALLQAAESCHQEGKHDQGSNSPRELASACEQLTEVVSAHASQRQELQQLATSSSKAPPLLVAAKHASTLSNRPRLQTQAARPVSQKDSKSSKSGANMEQRCSGADTAAWPPGPPQHSRGCSLQASSAQEAAESLHTQAEQSQDVELSCLTEAVHAPLAEQASCDYRQMAGGSASPAQPAAAAKQAAHQQHVTMAKVSNGNAAGSPRLLLPSESARHGETTQTVADCSNSSPARPDDSALASSNGAFASGPTSFGPRAGLTEAAKEVELSLGAVHAMLSALQLPAMDPAEPRDSSSCMVSLAHTCGLLHEPAMLDDCPVDEQNSNAPGTSLQKLSSFVHPAGLPICICCNVSTSRQMSASHQEGTRCVRLVAAQLSDPQLSER